MLFKYFIKWKSCSLRAHVRTHMLMYKVCLPIYTTRHHHHNTERSAWRRRESEWESENLCTLQNCIKLTYFFPHAARNEAHLISYGRHLSDGCSSARYCSVKKSCWVDNTTESEREKVVVCPFFSPLSFFLIIQSILTWFSYVTHERLSSNVYL